MRRLIVLTVTLAVANIAMVAHIARTATLAHTYTLMAVDSAGEAWALDTGLSYHDCRTSPSDMQFCIPDTEYQP